MRTHFTHGPIVAAIDNIETIDPWLFATGSLIVGVLSGLIGAALARSIIIKGREDRPERVDAGRAAATFVFLFFAVIGVIVAVGVTSRESLKPLPANIVEYSPHVLAAGLIFILGRAIGHALHGFTLRSLSRTSSRLRGQLAETLRFVVSILAAVLALRQLGIDIGILNILVAALMFGLALTFALLVGFGGRELGRELAYGRYLDRFLRVGDEAELGGESGLIVALHPATIELRRFDGTSVHVTNSAALNQMPKTSRRGPSASS